MPFFLKMAGRLVGNFINPYLIVHNIVLLLLPISMFWGRAALSIHIGVLAATSLSLLITKYLPIKKHWPYLLACFAFALIAAAGIFYGGELASLWQSVNSKLYIPVVLVSCLAMHSLSKAFFIKIITYLTLAACLQCLYNYYTNFNNITQGYNYAAVMPTPFGKEHIVFSAWVAGVFWLRVYNLFSYKINEQVNWLWQGIIVIFFVVFLHILAAKTGLIFFYLGLMIFLFQLFFKTKQIGFAKKLGIVVASLAIIVLCFTQIPSLKNRVNYVRYEWQSILNNKISSGFSDGARVASLHAGWDIFKNNWLVGVGFNQVENQAQQYYARHYPQLKPSEQWMPLSQILLYATASGVIGLLLFLIALGYLAWPLIKANTYFSWYVLLTNFVWLCIEIPFQGQYACTVFCLFWGLAGYKNEALKAQ
jgi:O-antigen ligase